ncbi:MAG: ParB/RepB/Spo0J family partition protein [Acidimicrobiales bacterium]
MAKVIEYREIPLDQLDIGQSQVRLHGTNRGIEELAESIAKQGLLQPILVAPTEATDRYEILIGQRRFMAHQVLSEGGRLQAPTIMAAVIDEPVEAAEAKAISLTENLLREGLSASDKIDACTYLYNKYGSIKLVAEVTGIPYNEVSENVKYVQLLEPLKQLVDSGDVKVKTALKAQRIAERGGGAVDTEAAIELAKEMSGMSGAQQKKIQERASEAPTMDASELIEDAKTGSKITQILVTLTSRSHAELQRYSEEQGTTQDEAAGSLIESGLAQAGYLES